jgi:DNA-directed RNA polymerase subunit RPC12/RpoP
VTERVCVDCHEPLDDKVPLASPRCHQCFCRMLEAVGLPRTCVQCGFKVLISPDARAARIPADKFTCRRCHHTDRTELFCSECGQGFTMPREAYERLDPDRPIRCVPCLKQFSTERAAHIARREEDELTAARRAAMRR